MKGDFFKRLLCATLSAALCFSIFAFSACSGGAGATVEELTKTVEELKAELAKVSKEQIEELKNKSAGLEEQVAALQKALAESDKQAEATGERLEELNKTIKLLSDTVTAGDLSNASLKEQIEQLKALIENGGAGGEELNSLKVKVAALEESLRLSQSNAEALKERVSELESGTAKMKEDLAQAQTASAELKKTVDELNARLLQAESRILLLEGKVDGDPNRVYGLGDTVSYSSNGLKLFELQITEAWKEETNGGNYNCFVNFTINNFNLYEHIVIGHLINSALMENGIGHFNETKISNYIPLNNFYSSAENNTALKYGFVKSTLTKAKVYFSLVYETFSSQSDAQVLPFYAYACFELEFPLRTV